jgi:hypothetical protein
MRPLCGLASLPQSERERCVSIRGGAVKCRSYFRPVPSAAKPQPDHLEKRTKRWETKKGLVAPRSRHFFCLPSFCLIDVLVAVEPQPNLQPPIGTEGYGKRCNRLAELFAWIDLFCLSWTGTEQHARSELAASFHFPVIHLPVCSQALCKVPNRKMDDRKMAQAHDVTLHFRSLCTKSIRVINQCQTTNPNQRFLRRLLNQPREVVQDAV